MKKWLENVSLTWKDYFSGNSEHFNESEFNMDKQEFSCCYSGLSFYHPVQNCR
jgi:hypothetical protein